MSTAFLIGLLKVLIFFLPTVLPCLFALKSKYAHSTIYIFVAIIGMRLAIFFFLGMLQGILFVSRLGGSALNEPQSIPMVITYSLVWLILLKRRKDIAKQNEVQNHMEQMP